MRIWNWICSVFAFEINENESKIPVLKCMAIVTCYWELSGLVAPSHNGEKWLPKCGRYAGCENSNGTLQSIFNLFRWFIIHIYIHISLKRWKGWFYSVSYIVFYSPAFAVTLLYSHTCSYYISIKVKQTIPLFLNYLLKRKKLLRN